MLPSVPELILIAIILAIVVGPRGFGKAARQVGKVYPPMRRVSQWLPEDLPGLEPESRPVSPHDGPILEHPLPDPPDARERRGPPRWVPVVGVALLAAVLGALAVLAIQGAV